MGLKDEAALLISSPNPKVRVRFPIRKDPKVNSKKAKAKKMIKTASGNGWISTKRPAVSTRKDKKRLKRIRKSIEKDSKIIDISDDSVESIQSVRRGTKQNASVFLEDSTDDEFVK